MNLGRFFGFVFLCAVVGAVVVGLVGLGVGHLLHSTLAGGAIGAAVGFVLVAVLIVWGFRNWSPQ